jgi:hypothetical protein
VVERKDALWLCQTENLDKAKGKEQEHIELMRKVL